MYNVHIVWEKGKAMAERVGRKSTWSSLSRFEQLTLASSILIWVGAVLFGGGLFVALRNYRAERVALAAVGTLVATPPVAASPTPTAVLFPAGWSTATPAPTPSVTPPVQAILRTRVRETPASGTTPQATRVVRLPTKEVREPVRIDGPGFPPPASQPPDRLTIPAIELDAPIVPVGWYTVQEAGTEYNVWQVADDAVGWHKSADTPGSPGNVVLSGHHNIKGEIFRYLVDLDVGDHVVVYVGDQAYHYAVEEKLILKEKGEPPEVREQNTTWIAPTEDERLTMVTCWPYTNNTHRLVVVSKPIPSPESQGLTE